MNQQTAETVLYAITAGACVVWLSGLLFVLRSRRVDAAESQADSWAEAGEAVQPSERIVSGSAVVDSDDPDLHLKAARLLVEGRLSLPVKVVRCDARELAFEPVITGRRARLRGGTIQFEPAGSGKTRIRWTLTGRRTGGALLWLAWLFQLLGLLAIAIGFWAISTYVVEHPNPSVRIQTVQMVQVVHFLWPPFLFAGLHRSFSRLLRNLSERLFDALAHNLPYVG